MWHEVFFVNKKYLEFYPLPKLFQFMDHWGKKPTKHWPTHILLHGKTSYFAILFACPKLIETNVIENED
jgi:hypothetical protein